MNRSGCYSAGKANSKHVTLNRKNRLCFSRFLYANVCMHKYMNKINTHTKWLQAYRVQSRPSECSHITHTHTHSFMSYSDSLTLGIKAEQCPHFTSVLRCSVSSASCRDYCCFARAHCSGIINQPCEFVAHYVTTAAPTILIFKDRRTCSIQQVLREVRTRINSLDQRFPPDPGPWELPKNGEVVQHIPQPERSHTCQQ